MSMSEEEEKEKDKPFQKKETEALSLFPILNRSLFCT